MADSWLEHCLVGTNGSHSDGADSDEKENHQDLIKLEVPRKNNARRPRKPHSTPATLQWLEENYEIAEGVCIPRSALYMHYLDFCERSDAQPVNAASFGKIIRQQFPQLTTRRLGTRGQSKYHYYGIGVKETSPYYDVMYSRKGSGGATGDPNKKDCSKQAVAYSPRSKLGTLLPEFPSIKDLQLPSNVSEDKVSTFIMMYRTHCQRILDTVIRANFDEVQSYLLHFWQGMPQHMVPILGSPTVVSIVGVCDSILYKAVAGVLMPSVLQALPDSLTQVIRKFALQLTEWLQVALDDLPDNLQAIKFDLAKRFSQVLKRQTSLNHLCQASRTVIQSNDVTSQMMDDWGFIDIANICRQTLYAVGFNTEENYETLVEFYTEFEHHLEEQASLETYTEWLDSMVDRCVVKKATKKPGSLKKVARQFLLVWSYFGTKIIREMTLHSSPSFGSFHLMHLMFDEYVLYLVESLHGQERANELLRSMKGENCTDLEELVLPNPVSTVNKMAADTLSSASTGGALHGTSSGLISQPEASRKSSIQNNSQHTSVSSGHSPHPDSAVSFQNNNNIMSPPAVYHMPDNHRSVQQCGGGQYGTQFSQESQPEHTLAHSPAFRYGIQPPNVQYSMNSASVAQDHSNLGNGVSQPLLASGWSYSQQAANPGGAVQQGPHSHHHYGNAASEQYGNYEATRRNSTAAAAAAEYEGHGYGGYYSDSRQINTVNNYYMNSLDVYGGGNPMGYYQERKEEVLARRKPGEVAATAAAVTVPPLPPREQYYGESRQKRAKHSDAVYNEQFIRLQAVTH